MWKAGQTRFWRTEDGYTFAAVLILLVALALGAQATVIPTSTSVQRAAEDELIHRGLTYVHAIESYWSADPEKPEFPPELAALLDDPREPGRRHIRRLVEPVIASEWRIIRADTGGIAGVSPVSDRPAFRRGDAPRGMEIVDNATEISGWQFLFQPQEE